jgi:hypothetical protein
MEEITIIKLPLPEIDENSHVYFTEAVKLVKESPSTNSPSLPRETEQAHHQ